MAKHIKIAAPETMPKIKSGKFPAFIFGAALTFGALFLIGKKMGVNHGPKNSKTTDSAPIPSAEPESVGATETEPAELATARPSGGILDGLRR